MLILIAGVSENTKLVVTGWGILDSAQNYQPYKLQKGAVYQVPDRQCKSVFGSKSLSVAQFVSVILK